LQGIVQAVSHMADKVGAAWIVAPFAFLLSVSIAGIGSAWLAGSARIPFVAGLDSYMPSWLGRVHPRYATPYAALIVHALVSMILIIVNFTAAGVQETFQKLLSLAVVLQLVPFLYMFGALLKLAAAPTFTKARYGRPTLLFAGASGLITTTMVSRSPFSGGANYLAAVLRSVDVGGTLLFVGLAAFFFFVYGRRKAARKLDQVPAAG